MPGSQTPAPEFSFPVDITALPPGGRTYEIEADAEELGRVARRLGVQSVESLRARFTLTPEAGGIVELAGQVNAVLTQTCVVTLAPVPAKIGEKVAARFAPYAPPVRRAAVPDGEPEEQLVTVTDDDPPDPAVDGKIDLGEVAVGQVALALNPYPRAPGASFDPAAWAAGDKNPSADSPFAALAALKNKLSS